MKILTGSQLGQDLCDALGIDANDVSGITVTCEAGRSAEVAVRRFVRDESAGKIQQVLKHYILIEAKNGS